MSFNEISKLYENKNQAMPDNVRLRVYRCLGWMQKAQLSGDDLDIRFISLWIAFNAAYAKDMVVAVSSGDRSGFRDFISLINRKANEELKCLVWNKYPNSIRMLMDNQYVFQPFWQFKNGLLTEDVWLLKFKESRQAAHKYLSNQDLESVLAIVFDRLYTLRNQIFHGGSTYGSSANRSQLKDACNLLEDCLTLFVSVIINCSDAASEWGEPFYPYVKD